MKQLISIVVVLVFVGGAGFAAKTLRGTPTPEDVAEAYVEKVAEKGGKGKDGYGDGESALGFFKFQRDFIVPVMRRQTVDSLVLLRLSVQMDEGRVEDLRRAEPRIRDAFMKTLMGLSHEGYFAQDITAPEVFEEIQTRLTTTAKETMDNSVQTVLIIDFARQDQ